MAILKTAPQRSLEKGSFSFLLLSRILAFDSAQCHGLPCNFGSSLKSSLSHIVLALSKRGKFRIIIALEAFILYPAPSEAASMPTS